MFSLAVRWMLSTSFVLASAMVVKAQSQAENQHLSVHISTAAESFQVGSRIDIDLDVSNSSAEEVVVPANIDRPELGGFEFDIKAAGDAPNSRIQMTTYMWMARGGTDPKQGVKDPDEEMIWLGPVKGRTSLAPNGTARFTALLNNLYFIGKPGRYSIQVRKWPRDGSGLIRPNSTEAEPEQAAVESNIIEITITEPPPPTIALELSTTSRSPSVGSEIDADLAVTNISAVPINLPFDPDHPSAISNGYKFTGLIPANGPISSSASPKSHYAWRPFNYQYPSQKTVQPDQTIHYPVRIYSAFDVSAPGCYTIEAEKVDPVTHLTVKSNTLTLAFQ